MVSGDSREVGALDRDPPLNVSSVEASEPRLLVPCCSAPLALLVRGLSDSSAASHLLSSCLGSLSVVLASVQILVSVFDCSRMI